MSDETDTFTRRSGKPLYEQVRSWLLAQVTSERWPVHHMLPPEIKLAEDLGVSRVTLRLAMSDLVQHGVFTRISGKGTFVAIQPDAQMHKISLLKPQEENEAQLVGVVVPDTASLFVSAILSHLEHALYERGYRMLLTNSQDSLAQQSTHLRQLVEFGVAGIVLYSGSFLHDETVNTLVRRGIPLVMIDRYYPSIETHVVASDHLRGAYVMTEHLLQLGHRRVGFVWPRASGVVTSTLARLEGYKAALKDYGVRFEEALVMQAQVRRETMQTYLQQAQPTALFASSDERAIDCLHVLHALHLRIPDDIVLVGFDNLPLVSRVDPPLTTIAQNIPQIGETSAQLLIDAVEGRVQAPKTILLPTELVVRQSCGAKSEHPGDARTQTSFSSQKEAYH